MEYSTRNTMVDCLEDWSNLSNCAQRAVRKVLYQVGNFSPFLENDYDADDVATIALATVAVQ